MSSSITSVAFLGAGLKLAPLAASGVVLAASPADAAHTADVVCLCLADAAAIEQVVFGVDGVVAATRSGQIVVDFSTIGPSATLQAASPGRCSKCFRSASRTSATSAADKC